MVGDHQPQHEETYRRAAALGRLRTNAPEGTSMVTRVSEDTPDFQTSQAIPTSVKLRHQHYSGGVGGFQTWLCFTVVCLPPVSLRPLCPLPALPLLSTLLEVPSLGRQRFGLSGEKVRPFITTLVQEWGSY